MCGIVAPFTHMPYFPLSSYVCEMPIVIHINAKGHLCSYHAFRRLSWKPFHSSTIQCHGEKWAIVVSFVPYSSHCIFCILAKARLSFLCMLSVTCKVEKQQHAILMRHHTAGVTHKLTQMQRKMLCNRFM